MTVDHLYNPQKNESPTWINIVMETIVRDKQEYHDFECAERCYYAGVNDAIESIIKRLKKLSSKKYCLACKLQAIKICEDYLGEDDDRKK